VLLLLFIGNAILVALTSLLLVAALRAEFHGLISIFVGWALGCFLIVASGGVVLGEIGHFTAVGFCWLHLGTFTLALIIRRKTVKADVSLPQVWARQAFQLVKEDRYLRWAVLALSLFMLVTVILAATGQPGIYDSLTYRLSRIGHWLQEGTIGFITTNDPRQNYMPVVPDIMMAWILGAKATGFASAALAQWAGGILLLAATAGMARQLGLSRFASMASACLVAGAANVAPQFTTTQTDLITAGLLAASFFLWRSAACFKKGSIFSGLAAGMALGSKGTVFYLLPSLGLMALWYAWQSRLPLKAWRLSLLATCLSIGIFFAPGIVRNLVHYEGIFGPEEFVVMHHHTEGGRWLEKTKLNLASFLIQSLEPHSQMPGVAFVTQAIAEQLITFLPVHDPFTFEGMSRRDTLDGLINRGTPDADSTTFGVLIMLLLALGAVISVVFWRRKGADEVRVVCLGIGVYFIFFHAMQLWHPYGYRYFILAAPWIAIVGVWFLEGIRYPVRVFVWCMVLISSIGTALNTLYSVHNAGRGAVLYPRQSIFSYVNLNWTDWLNTLTLSGDSIYVLLPFNRPLAPFYRLENSPQVKTLELSSFDGLTAEQAVAQLPGAWLITFPRRFLGNEGNVVRREWFFRNDPNSPFSIVAYRAVVP